MNKIFAFFAGMMCGAVVGGVAALLLTPASGEDLRVGATSRLDEAVREMRQAMDERRIELESQFQQMTKKE